MVNNDKSGPHSPDSDLMQMSCHKRQMGARYSWLMDINLIHIYF